MALKRFRVSPTTASDGTVTALTPRFSGELVSINYTKDATIPYATGVDFTITSKATGENLWTQANVDASAIVYPRAPTHSQVGAAALFAAGGTAVQAMIAMANDQVQIAIAQGGSAKVGRFDVVVRT